MNGWFAVAGTLTILVMCTHLVLGGRKIAKPLMAAKSLDEVPKYTSYYCWHLVTIMQFLIALAFLVAATQPGEIYLALFATVSVVLSLAWSLLMITIFRLPLWHFPQWALYIPPGACGIAGFLV